MSRSLRVVRRPVPRSRSGSSWAAWKLVSLVVVVVVGLVASRAVHADAVVPIPPAPSASPAPVAPSIEEADATVLALEGHPLVQVGAVVEDALWPDVASPKLGPPARGEKLSPAVARKYLDEAMSSGRFADGIAVATDDGQGGARLTIRLSPRKIVESVHVTLHEAPFTREEVSREADLAEGSELVARDIPRLKSKIVALFARRGYPASRVTLGTSPGEDREHVVVELDVVAGTPRNVDKKIFFYSRGSAENFRRFTEDFAVPAGTRADEAVIATASSQLEQKLRQSGYHRAVVTTDLVAVGGEVILRVRMDPGPRFEPRFEGNDHYDSTALGGALALDADPDLSQGHLVQKLAEFYKKRGYLDVEVAMETRGKLEDPLVFMVFKIHEHGRVAVHHREYPCLVVDDLKNTVDAPSTVSGIGDEMDSYLDEELPGQDFLQSPRPSGVDAVLGPNRNGTRVTPTDLSPNSTYFPETYERAMKHVQELYRSEGFLSAEVGPLQLIRPFCKKGSLPGMCEPVAVPQDPQVCNLDPQGVPLPLPAPDLRATCVPDPAKGIECASWVVPRIPIRLGPQSKMYDASFSGVKAFTTKELAREADLEMGQPVSSAKIDEARRRVIDLYQRKGYAYAEVATSIDLSQDRSNAHVRFRVNEQEQVFVRSIKIRGNVYTHTQTIEKRIALEVGKPYGSDEVRKTEERIATLNVFSSVAVTLEDPNVPQKNKNVIVTVVERPRHSIEVAPGISTGEGARVSLQYGHTNLFGRAIGFTALLQLSYLPTAFVLDSTARQNYENLPFEARLGSRATVGIQFPEIGLGPLVGFGIDAVGTHDLRRDYYLTKIAGTPSITIRPRREITLQFGQAVEFNNLRVLAASNLKDYLSTLTQDQLLAQARILNLPEGETVVIAQRGNFTWDLRDNPLDATRGILLTSSVEHVDALPLGSDAGLGTKESHFIKYFNRFNFYFKLPFKIRFASSTSVGVIQQLTSTSTTYPDRLFFLGGQDMRGWYVQQFIPQDDLDALIRDEGRTDAGRFTIQTQPVRGGDLMAVQRFEFRIPFGSDLVETVAFADLGNMWRSPRYPFETGEFPIRADVGSGLRVKTPVAPIALDFGYNVTRKRAYEDPFAFSFSLGLF
jgi:outer membrane protein assembly factor BamA